MADHISNGSTVRNQQEPTRSRANLRLWIFSGVGVLLLFTPEWWPPSLPPLWAFAHLSLIPIVWRTLLAFGLLVPPLGELLARNWRTPLRVGFPSLNVTLLGTALLFWLGREKSISGDGLLKLTLIEEGRLIHDPYLWKEPLDTILAYAVSGMTSQLGLGVEIGIPLLSILAGVIFTGAAWQIARLLLVSDSDRLLLFLSLFTLGSSQLWFGHTENYSLNTSASYVTVALALAYRRSIVPIWLVGLSAGLSISLHPQSLVLLPPLLLILRPERRLRHAGRLLLGATIVPLVTLGWLLGLGAQLPSLNGGYAGDEQLFLTLAQAVNPAQVWDSVMNLWLIAPALPLILFGGLRGLTTAALRGSRDFRYLSGVAGALLVYHFTFQNDLPRSQDWDLFAIVGPGLALWGTLPLLEHRSRTQSIRSYASEMVIVTLFAAVMSGAFIFVNHQYRLVIPDLDQRALLSRYEYRDLIELLPGASVEPATGICPDPQDRSELCRRVDATGFTLPEIGGVYRPVLFAHAPARLTFDLTLPEEPVFLWTGAVLDPVARSWGGDGVTFRIHVESGEGSHLLWEHFLIPEDPRAERWRDVALSLSDFRNQSIRLILETGPGPEANSSADRSGWAEPVIFLGTPIVTRGDFYE